MSQSAQAREFLVFSVSDQAFALPAHAVREVLSPQPVTALPFVPPFVDGLVNAGDRVLPLLGLDRLLFPAEGHRPETRHELLVVEDGASLCALRVQKIVGQVLVSEDDIKPIQASVDMQAVAGIFNFQFDHDGAGVLVIDAGRLSALIRPRELPEGNRGVLGRIDQGASETVHDHMHCLVIRVGDERYAMALENALEILDMGIATPMPGAPLEIEGMAVVRDEVLLVLSMAQLLRRGTQAVAARHVVVVEAGQARYGIRVDAVEGIVPFDAKALRPVEDDASELAGVLVHEGVVYGLLTPGRLLSPAREAVIRSFVPDARQQKERIDIEMCSLLQVTIAHEAYAFPLAKVRRIVPFMQPERLATDEAAFVTGAVNMDGNVVPVVDLASHLGLGERPAYRELVVVGDESCEWAIPVTEAREIIDIPVSVIDQVESRRSGFVAGVANIGQRLVSLLSLLPLEQSPVVAGQKR